MQEMIILLETLGVTGIVVPKSKAEKNRLGKIQADEVSSVKVYR